MVKNRIRSRNRFAFGQQGSSDVPVNIIPPQISGVGYTGQIMFAIAGVWQGATTVTGQWHADGVPISGETTFIYVVTSDTDGAAFTYVETAQPGNVTAVSNEIHNWTFDDTTTAVWVDGSDTSTLTDTLGSVSQWDDKSGNNNHAVQATAIDQPTTGIATINGLNAVNFNAEYMSLTSLVSSARAFFYVVNNAAGSPGQVSVTPLTGESTSNADYIFIRTNNTDYTISVDGGNNKVGSASFNGGALVSGLNIDLGLSDAEKASDNVITVTYPATTVDVALLGRFTTFEAFVDMGEIAILLTDPSTDIRQRSEGYLAHKWGLTAKLPVTHPYKTVAPTV